MTRCEFIDDHRDAMLKASRKATLTDNPEIREMAHETEAAILHALRAFIVAAQTHGIVLSDDMIERVRALLSKSVPYLIGTIVSSLVDDMAQVESGEKGEA